jgi:hypothetical protein
VGSLITAALRDARLFRAGAVLPSVRDRLPSGLPSGIAELDAALPWGGFPRNALTELLYARPGVGELSLLVPALPRSGRIALVTPPYLPYAPALVQAGLALDRLCWIVAPAERSLWAAEQCLRAGCLTATLIWNDRTDDRALRRLQLAAVQGGSMAFLFRPLRFAANPSPAALRLWVEREQLRVLKCRGAIVTRSIIDRRVCA